MCTKEIVEFVPWNCPENYRLRREMSELMSSNALGGLNQIDSDSGARRKSQNSQLDRRRQILSQGFFPIEVKRRDLGLK